MNARPTSENAAITIRIATADDELELVRLAALDSAETLPASPVLLGEVDGKLRAALSLSDGVVIADPFHLTGDLVGLLRTHAIRATRRERPRRTRFALRYA